MKILGPSRLAFWRSLLLLSGVLPLLASAQVAREAAGRGIDLTASTAWQGLIVLLALTGIVALVFLALTWSRQRERILQLLEMPERIAQGPWIGLIPAAVGAAGFTILFAVPAVQESFAGLGWVRFFIFWSFSLLGMWGIRRVRGTAPWFVALLSIVLVQSTLHLLLVYWPRVTEYPFAMGWSETSRFYYPSLFLSELVYGRAYPWPILHPTLHLLLAPPYLFDAPLWVHRFWQVALRYLLLAAVVPALWARFSFRGGAVRALAGLWMFLFLFMGPVYFHLTIPLILVLLGFSPGNQRRTWLVILLASIWCGWSRLNWYQMPGMIAAVLYLLEIPHRGQDPWSYLLRPALWTVGGTLTAYLSQQLYIFISGIPDSGIFYTSLASDLLWYRLWPNSSYFLGILPGAILASLPAWIVMYIVIRSRRADWHPLRLALIAAALLVLFLGGLVVSLKIGGGANLHNMDAYFSLLLIVLASLVFAHYQPEDGSTPQPVPLHWLLVVALVLMPAWSYLQFNIGVHEGAGARTREVMQNVQEHLDQVADRGGEVLFITQRHLVSMHMLEGVTLVPEYEREDLMEIAMADDTAHIRQFREAMEDQRFALIVVDPLNYNLLSRSRSFAEENNVWVTRIMKHILCNYRQEAVFPEDEIALYVPQEGTRQCP